ncbi:MAG: B12-binding domain-containing radical SAM protein [Anaerohalosphaeraceae bacterium]|nr:B12-binding domain-containing radical SAM protein [Anaerohalosphaeraceae bacterium]
MTKKVTLVIPNYEKIFECSILSKRPLLGIGYIAAVLMQNGWAVNVVDAFAENLTPQQALKRLLDFDAKIVGVSVNLLAYSFSKEFTKLCHNNDVKVVVGGPEVIINPEGVINGISPDVAVIGEGEQTTLELLSLLESGGHWNPEVLLNIKGIVFRNTDGEIIRTDTRPRMKNLNDLPFMPYELFPIKNYDLRYGVLPHDPIFSVYTSRGCPFNCSFCSNREVWQRKAFYMSAERVLDEIEHISKKYMISGINFHDDCFPLNRQRVVDICEGLLKRDIKISWMCPARADKVDEELLKLMKRAGCRNIWFGIESGSERILSLIRKEIDTEQALEAIQLVKKTGIAVAASIMVGLPTQTMAEDMQTIKFLEKAKCTLVYMAPYVGYPGSDLYKEFLREDNKYVYKRIGTFVLPNSEDMTWPEKVVFARRYSRKFNMTFRRIGCQINNFGLFTTAKMGLNKILSRK